MTKERKAAVKNQKAQLCEAHFQCGTCLAIVTPGSLTIFGFIGLSIGSFHAVASVGWASSFSVRACLLACWPPTLQVERLYYLSS